MGVLACQHYFRPSRVMGLPSILNPPCSSQSLDNYLYMGSSGVLSPLLNKPRRIDSFNPALSHSGV